MNNKNMNKQLTCIVQMLCDVTKELISASEQLEHTPTPKYKRSKPKRFVHGNIGKVRSPEHKIAIGAGRRKPFVLTIDEPNDNEPIIIKYDSNSPCIQMQKQLGISARYIEQMRGEGYVVRRRSNTRHSFLNGSIIKLSYLKNS